MNQVKIALSVCMIFIIASVRGSMVCNGSALLCDRRYNEVAQLISHNATSFGFSPVQDQDRTVQEQLADGIRAFKIPLHFDYADRLGYYNRIITLYIQELDKEIAQLQQDVAARKNKIFLTLEEKRQEVHRLQRLVDETQADIDNKKRWFNGLPRFAWRGDSQLVRGIDYAATIVAWEIKRGTLIAAKESALQVLYAAQKAGEFFVEQDPHLNLLIARKKLLEQTALPLTAGRGDRTVFACHALPKYELYGDFVGQLTRSAPEILQPILEVVLAPLGALHQASVHALYGKKEDVGGLFPYPACLLDSSAMTLYDFLMIIKNFLRDNPHEVITILFNDFVANDEAVAAIFEQSGIVPYAYTHDRTQPWPTLQQLITSGKRLIVFSDNGGADKVYQPSWINNRYFYDNVWPNNYQFSSADVFINEHTPLDVFGKFAYRDTVPPMNKLLYITYAVTPGMAGSKKEATRINEYQHSVRHFKRIADAAGHVPNWISVDFYTHPNNDLMRAVKTLNEITPVNGAAL